MPNAVHAMPVTGNTEHTQPENRAFYPALDGLRAIAFLMVFSNHYYAIPCGWSGVNMFFVLSGFLITGILFDTRNDPHRARNFYIRRSLRIFPLYYGIFLLILVAAPFVHWQWSLEWIAWPLYLGNFLHFLSPAAGVIGSLQELAADARLHPLTAQGWDFYLGHFWSLCVEEQFYLIWPWIVFRITSRRALIWICGAAVIVTPLLRVAAQAHAPVWMLQQSLLLRILPFQIDSLLLGGLLALLWRGANQKLLLRLGRMLAFCCTVAVAIFLCRTIHLSDPNWTLHYKYPTWTFTWGLSVLNLFTVTLILCCLSPLGWVARALSFRPLRWLGRISYGAYVFHDIVHIPIRIGFLELGLRHPYFLVHTIRLTAICGLISTILIAWLSFRFFESPFLNLKERWTRRA